jgi:hypothetical protein
MPQITRTTNDAIIGALYLIGELGVGETPDNFMLSTGLEIINEILDGFAADSIYVPFLTTIDFVMTVGKDRYSVSDIVPADINADRIIDLSFANYTVQPQASEPIVYPMRIINKATYYNVVRLQNLLARPGFILLDKQATESFLIVYPAPDQPYPCSVQCKVMINSLTANQDLTDLPPFYYGFLKYAIGREFRSYYPSANWNETAEEKYQDYISTLKNANETDLTIRPSVTMTAPEPFYWPNILAY